MSTVAELLELPGVEVRPGAAGALRVHGVVPEQVAAPASAQAAAAVLRLASARGWRVELAGRGACLDGGRPPGRLDVLLTSERLTDVPDYAPADLTVSAGAGVTLGELAARLAPHGQFLPLDPPGWENATLGAVVAGAAAGPLRLGYGTPRDHVLGLELVTGDGRVLQLGGRVMKNVAGYDLVRLVTGSRGTLGLITRVTAKLRPLPEADATLALRSPTEGGCLAAAAAIRQARLEPVAMELLSPEASAHVPAAGAWTLLVRLHGTPAAVDAAAHAVAALAGGDGVTAERLDAAVAAMGWRALDALEAQAAAVVRLAARPSELPRTLALATAVAEAAGDCLRLVHAGDGIVRLLLDGPGAARDGVPAALERARLTLSAESGTVALARAPRALAERVDPLGPIPAAALMRGIRASFDPAGVLAPGRLEMQVS